MPCEHCSCPFYYARLRNQPVGFRLSQPEATELLSCYLRLEPIKLSEYVLLEDQRVVQVFEKLKTGVVYEIKKVSDLICNPMESNVGLDEQTVVSAAKDMATVVSTAKDMDTLIGRAKDTETAVETAQDVEMAKEIEPEILDEQNSQVFDSQFVSQDFAVGDRMIEFVELPGQVMAPITDHVGDWSAAVDDHFKAAESERDTQSVLSTEQASLPEETETNEKLEKEKSRESVDEGINTQIFDSQFMSQDLSSNNNDIPVLSIEDNSNDTSQAQNFEDSSQDTSEAQNLEDNSNDTSEALHLDLPPAPVENNMENSIVPVEDKNSPLLSTEDIRTEAPTELNLNASQIPEVLTPADYTPAEFICESQKENLDLTPIDSNFLVPVPILKPNPNPKPKPSTKPNHTGIPKPAPKPSTNTLKPKPTLISKKRKFKTLSQLSSSLTKPITKPIMTEIIDYSSDSNSDSSDDEVRLAGRKKRRSLMARLERDLMSSKKSRVI